MKKYGKYIKKTRRTFRKASRFARKARRVRLSKRFARRVNNVGEKKLSVSSFAASPLTAATSTGVITNGLIKTMMPAKGTEINQRIGNGIFIRYIHSTIWITPVGPTHQTAGRVGVLTLKERTARGLSGLQLNTFFDSGYPVLNINQYKNRQLKKMYLKTRNMDLASTELPKAVCFKYKFKIMRNCTFDVSDNPSIPDIHLFPVYFAAPFSVNGDEGPSEVFGRHTMTFTDI